MGIDKQKSDVNIRIDLFVHHDPDTELLKLILENNKILNNLNLKINKVMATQKEIDEGLDALEAGNAAQLALSQKIDADIIRLEEAAASGLNGAALLARIRKIRSDSETLTAALKAVDDKTPEDVTPPVEPTQFTADTGLFTDFDGSLTDVDTGTPAFQSGQTYNVVTLSPLTLTGIDGDHDISDWTDSFTAVPA